ncbi:winged helix-turn-helix transcriptional regulator [Azospirillum picis]|uniref:DNA-binding HxlR family transcriptional regulator n=1 Tax=Azospirillum picis TaxID=488438 RepID=A0ABU0MKY6_9PROT|nr:helix-turn-helix domain-containing protein [Azospirillum picis]MBP2300321.1 DNA-binding HxlR family transcriptional regulator [Azospirillum picis]MDQ0534117.1 DNA-binding HxlR family transcriptional regulator [Azospirillum picis]
MRRTRLTDAPCPIARGLHEVAESWSLLILRDAMRGLTRFDEFQRSIGLATNMLARRLQTLVEAGLLERRPYQERPPRHAYHLTAKGRDFLPVLVAMADWGNRWLMPDGAFRLVDRETGRTVDPLLIDRNTGRAIRLEGIRSEMPAAGTPPAAAPTSEEHPE